VTVISSKAGFHAFRPEFTTYLMVFSLIWGVSLVLSCRFLV
jgi:hypothetical protein